MTEHKLKGLQTYKQKLKNELIVKKWERDDLNINIKNIEDKIADINKEILILKNTSKEVIISEHAIIRYLERVMGINIEEIKKSIVNEEQTKLIKSFQPKKLKTENMTLIIRDNVIITVE